MTRALVNEINTFIEVYDDEINDKEKIKPYFLFIKILILNTFMMKILFMIMMKDGSVQLIEL